jgi:two-component system, NarL family, sensor kinase
MQSQSSSIAILIIITTSLLLFLGLFIIGMLFIYQKRKLAYENAINDIRANSEKLILKTELEIKEQTFQNISREIHDNICLNLTLVKLKLNTFDGRYDTDFADSISSSVNLLSKAIQDLSDISRTLNSEVIKEQGLIKALQLEVKKIESLSMQNIDFEILGSPVFFDSNKDLIIFRIIQECFNNIIKHAKADTAFLLLDYNKDNLHIEVKDSGCGFDLSGKCKDNERIYSSGLTNIKKRVEMIDGTINISSALGKGTVIKIDVPVCIKKLNM